MANSISRFNTRQLISQRSSSTVSSNTRPIRTDTKPLSPNLSASRP